MARKPNYQFDRVERDRQKASKKADRLAAKQAKTAEKRGDDPTPPLADGTETPDTSVD